MIPAGAGILGLPALGLALRGSPSPRAGPRIFQELVVIRARVSVALGALGTVGTVVSIILRQQVTCFTVAVAVAIP